MFGNSPSMEKLNLFSHMYSPTAFGNSEYKETKVDSNNKRAKSTLRMGGGPHRKIANTGSTGADRKFSRQTAVPTSAILKSGRLVQGRAVSGIHYNKIIQIRQEESPEAKIIDIKTAMSEYATTARTKSNGNVVPFRSASVQGVYHTNGQRMTAAP